VVYKSGPNGLQKRQVCPPSWAYGNVNRVRRPYLSQICILMV